MYHEGKFDWDRGILIDDELIRFFCDPKLLKLSRRRNRSEDSDSAESEA